MAYLYNKQHRPPPMNTPGKDHLGHCNQSLIIADNQGIKFYCTIYNNRD